MLVVSELSESDAQIFETYELWWDFHVHKPSEPAIIVFIMIINLFV